MQFQGLYAQDIKKRKTEIGLKYIISRREVLKIYIKALVCNTHILCMYTSKIYENVSLIHVS